MISVVQYILYILITYDFFVCVLLPYCIVISLMKTLMARSLINSLGWSCDFAWLEDSLASGYIGKTVAFCAVKSDSFFPTVV